MPNPTPSTIILLHFAEPAGVLPSDAGNLDDLGVETGIAMPPVIENTWTGRGRAFSEADATGLVAIDRAGRDTLLQRDVTVQAIVAYTPNSVEQVLIAGGIHDGTEPENPDYGIQFLDVGANLEVRWFHSTPGTPGTIRYAPPGVFEHLGDGKYFLFTATRRWESSSLVVVRYYVGPEMVAELEWDQGEIGGGTTGHTSIGALKTGGSWGAHWNGVIDELLVTNFEMGPEEVRHTWRRLTEYQPAGVDMFVGLSPPGLPWYANPANSLGRRVKIAGQAIGQGVAAAEELRALWPPDAAPIAHIPKWEELCGLTAKPRDSLDVRRARVVAYLQREEGFSHPAVKTALEGVLDLASDDIEIVEFTNEIRDPFDTLETERWIVEPEAEWSIVASQLRLATAAGQSVTADPLHARHIRLPLERGGSGRRLFVAVKIAAAAAASVPASSGVGILLYNRASDNYLWFGVYNDAGTMKLAWQKRLATVTSAVTFLGAAPAAPLWLRLYNPQAHGAINDTAGAFRAAWSNTGPSAGFTTSAFGATGVIDSEWAGLAATGGTLGGNLQADFDDFVAYCPDGDRTFCWYAYRDPGFDGDADMVGARLLVNKIKPAHTHAAAIRSKSVLCDDLEFGLCDTGPMGGL
ncbi:MAG TPA: hypothetical protein VN253_03010 [Kofleriaceae bacterium]|nr:hypothetical protein [Kofleriaceae bacterium]